MIRKSLNKKGISAIVATVLVILITVAAVSIIWAAVVPMVKNTLESAAICSRAIEQIDIRNKGWTCFDGENNIVKVQVGHGPKAVDLVGVTLLISTAGNSFSYVVSSDLPDINEESVFEVEYLEGVPESVQIAAIVKRGNLNETCSVSMPVVLRSC